MAETAFAETEALLAALRDDDETARRLVEEMTPTERRYLAKGLELLRHFVEDRCDHCGKMLEGLRDTVAVGPLGGPVAHLHRACESEWRISA